MRCGCYALIALVPFYLLVRAASAWTPHPRFFPDDAVYARMCLPSGLLVYWNDFGFYRLLAVPAYALSNRAVMSASLSPVPFTFIALASATVVFVWSCVGAGLSVRRGALLAGVLLSSPLLLETLNFWSGTFNYALVLLLVAAQLHASRRALLRFRAKLSRGYLVTAGGALLALLTYEIALPFILATAAFYTRRGWRLLAVCIACTALLALVGALVWSGVYWPVRFKLMAEQLAYTVSGTPAPGIAPAPSSAPVPSGALERAAMYASLLFSFISTGVQRSTWFWTLAGALAALSFLSRPLPEKATARATEKATGNVTGNVTEKVTERAAGKTAADVVAGDVATEKAAGDVAAEEQAGDVAADERAGRLPGNLVALSFAFALGSCVVYLLVTKSLNARYVAFLLIYGAATLAWTKGRAAGFALASLLLLQAAVAASLPVHLRDVEAAAKGEVVSSPTGSGDTVSVSGRLARASWGKRFFAPEPPDLLKQPLNARACRYAVPCEECK